MRATSSVLVSGLLLASVATADVIVKMKETTDLASSKPRVSTGSMILGADRLVMRWDDAKQEGHGSFIFRGDKELMWIVNDQAKTYEQIDKAFIDQAAAQLDAARAETQAQLDKMPAEQRAQAEEMMKKYAGAMQGAAGEMKLDYRKTTESQVIDGHRCTKYDVYQGDDLVSHAWVAPYADLGLTLDDGAVFQKMGEFGAKLTGPFANMEKRDYIPMHEVGGVPLLSQDIEDGKVTRETRVESVTRGSGPSSCYDVPAGYKLKPMPSMAHKK